MGRLRGRFASRKSHDVDVLSKATLFSRTATRYCMLASVVEDVINDLKYTKDAERQRLNRRLS